MPTVPFQVSGPARVQLRTVQQFDDAFLLVLYASTRDDLITLRMPRDQHQLLVELAWRDHHDDHLRRCPSGIHRIVTDLGVDVGRVWTHEEADATRIVDIALLPVARNRGIGSGLIRALQETATAQARALRLSVHVANEGAVRLGEALGFCPSGELLGCEQEMLWPCPEAARSPWRPDPVVLRPTLPPCSSTSA